MEKDYTKTLVGMTKAQATRELGWWWSCERISEDGLEEVLRHGINQLYITYDKNGIVTNVKKGFIII